MDKELLRVVIIMIGMLVMIGMLLWHFFKSLRERREADGYFEDLEYGPNGDDFEVDEDDMDIFPMEGMVDGDALLDDRAIKPTPKSEPKSQSKSSPSHELPVLIEFSIVARAD